MRKTLSTILSVVILCNFIIFGFMSYTPVEAGFWDDNKDGIMTVIKGFLMLWIMNLVRENVVDNNDDIITSTIKKGLNIADTSDDEVKNKIVIEETSNLAVSEQEQRMIEMVNEVRVNNGLPVLKTNERLTEIARMKARDMINKNYFDHYSPTYGTPFTMMQEQNIDYLLAGENLASSKTVEKGFNGLMNSQEHRENIMDSRYDSIGIGIITEESGNLIIVQLFTDSPDLSK